MRRLAAMTVTMLLMLAVAHAEALDLVRPGYSCRIREDGTVSSLTCGSAHVGFFGQGRKTGPTLYIYDGSDEVRGRWQAEGNGCFSCLVGDVSAKLVYDLASEDLFSFTVTLRNCGRVDFTPVKAGIALGVDTYMDEYPSWLSKYFPTLLMNERTHFYGYFQSPEGHLLGIMSPDPVASWSVDSDLSYYDIPGYWFYGHRIGSVNIDLLNALPLPAHNPQDLWRLAPGEERSWTLSFVPVSCTDAFEEDMCRSAGIPMLDMPRTSCRAGDTLGFTVVQQGTKKPSVTIRHESGRRVRASMKPLKREDGLYRWKVQARFPSAGRYDVEVVSGGYRPTAVVLAGRPWADVLKDARQAAWDNHQKPSSHVESWYGFHSAFLAARHFPEAVIDSLLDDRFDLIYDKLFDRQAGIPKVHAGRIQNTSSTIGMLVDRYQAYGRIGDLEQAAALADWLIGYSQAEEGAYMSGNVKYTSVIYVAKSLMELHEAEAVLAAGDEAWAERSMRHYDSVRRAIDELVASQGDFGTEGEMTFEDGMVSCSALQTGLFALMQEDEGLREHYKTAMLDILRPHDCLTQLKVNDGRRRGGTLRFWEAQYDVLMLPNMFCSPHGWSAWRAYASYYAYLLTLDERYLVETFNAAYAFAALIGDGKLHWAFITDPYVRARQVADPVEGLTFDDVTFGNPHPDVHGTVELTVGEQYMDMISSWQPAGSQDNDVHEVFKFIEEAVLTNAFIVEREDGSVAGYNCTVSRHGSRLTVIPAEPQITNLHRNLRSDFTVVWIGDQAGS